MADTRQRLMAGALDTVRERGLAGTSARSIATAAGVNQALVFYHFGSVAELVAAACQAATVERVAAFGARFEAVTDLGQLLAVGRELAAEERALGNVTVLAQLLAGAQHDPVYAQASAVALRLWTEQVEQVLTRLFADSPLIDVLDLPGLAAALSASFVGLGLYQGVDPAGADAALAALDRLAVLVELVEGLGPVARRAVRARARRAAGGR